MFANIFSVVIVGSWAAGFPLTDPAHKLAKPQLAALLILLLLFNYGRFIRGGAADDLIQRLDQQRRHETDRDETRLFYYVVGSLVFPFLLGLAALALHLH
jgi:hypothetical protein